MNFWRGNMRDVQEGGGSFELVPEGRHLFEVSEVQETTTKSNGDPMATVKLVLVNGDGWVWDNIIFPYANSPAIKILGRSKGFLRAAGLPCDDEDLVVNPQEWMYRKVLAEIVHEHVIKDEKPVLNRDGKQRLKAVVRYYVVPEESPAPVDAIDPDSDEAPVW